MKPRYKVSRAGIELIKTFEGYRRSAAQLADGRWTLGYGHTKTARKGAEVSEDDAAALLQYDLMEISAAVNDLVFTPLTQNQFDALASFASNVGLESFRKSTVLRRVNEGSMLQAAWALEMWRKADFEGQEIVVDALVRRRAAEKALFLTPADGWVAAPSPVLPPRFDADVSSNIPTGQPVNLRASLVGETATVVREAPSFAFPAAPQAETAPEVAPEIAAMVEELTAELATPAPVEHPVAPHPASSGEIAIPPLAESSLSQFADASQALSARLEAILPSVARPAPLSDARSDLDLPVASSVPTEPMLSATPVGAAVATPSLPEPELFERPHSETPRSERPWSNPIAFTPLDVEEPQQPLAASTDLFQRPIYREQAADDATAFEGQPVHPVKLTFVPYLLVAVLGLIIFAAAMTWAFGAHTGGLTFGVPMAIVGIGCVAWSVYSLISRFSEPNE